MANAGTKLVLVAPHAIPPDWLSEVPPQSVHLHDSLAPVMAECIRGASATLRDNRIEVVQPFVPLNTSRDECDLNRRRRCARLHPFRQRLRDYVTRQATSILMVLDLHSYPPGHPFWSDYFVVVLDDDEDRDGVSTWYVRDFVSFMNANGVPTAARRGQHNDIVNEMRVELGMQAMLLEFNESLMPGAPAGRFRQQVCRLVLAWSNRFYQTNLSP